MLVKRTRTWHLRIGFEVVTEFLKSLSVNVIFAFEVFMLNL
jgi:hypothetical protein